MKRLVALITLLAALGILALAVAAQEEEEDPFTALRLPLDHEHAPFLETYEYGLSVGVTSEFRKMEWIAIDNNNMRIYYAMSTVERGMSDGEGDIDVPENQCGVIYVADLDENYQFTTMRPLIEGGPYDPEGGANRCSVDNISNPDGLYIDANGRLWIGEDTGNHENNMIWVYDPADESLTRFGYTPVGAEVTGLLVTEQGDVFYNVQHPSAMAIYPFNSSSIGVVQGFNALTDSFTSIPVPEGDDKLIAATAAGTYTVLQRNGDPIANDPYGMSAGQVNRVDGSTQYFCNAADGNMWLPTNEAGTVGYLYTNFECRPGGVSRLDLQKAEDGTWSVVDGEVVDFSAVNGTWINCGSSVTPWNTGLTSEEYPPSTYAGVEALSDYLGTQANPYDYGYAVELAPQAVGNDIQKHYAMGRHSLEMAIVAGDNMTVFFGDDGTDRPFAMFIADNAGDLSAGTLYGARITQIEEGESYAFQFEWIELGHGVNDEIEATIRSLDSDS